MKIIENVTLYQCEFCKKEYKRKYFAIQHEPKCRNNPINYQKCLDGCIHLVTKEMNYSKEIQTLGLGLGVGYDHEETLINAFWCSKKEHWVYPFWCNNPILSEDITDEVENEVMPSKCDLYSNDNKYFM